MPQSAPSAVSLSVTPTELRGADPCKLIDEKVLAEFGKVEYDKGTGYGQCDILLHAPDDESVSVSVHLQASPSYVSTGDPAPPAVLRDGVTSTRAKATVSSPAAMPDRRHRRR